MITQDILRQQVLVWKFFGAKNDFRSDFVVGANPFKLIGKVRKVGLEGNVVFARNELQKQKQSEIMYLFCLKIDFRCFVFLRKVKTIRNNVFIWFENGFSLVYSLKEGTNLKSIAGIRQWRLAYMLKII
jgi:hypothetical protein